MPSNARNLANLLGAGEATISAEKLGNDVPPGTEDYSSIDSLGVGTTVGETAFVEGSNRLYIWNGSGWYNIALINTTPTWDSGGQPEGSYVLDADSPQDATVITLAASDPEGIPISYNYITSGSMDSIATISQDSSVFTITPKTSVQAPDGGTGSITFRATDGINILPQVSNFTLDFVFTVTNSKYTTLLATATDTSDNNNITDASSNNHTITVNGDAHAGTFSPYRSGGYSMYFDGSDYVDLGNGNLAIDTEDFTIETWVNVTIGSNMLVATNSNWNSGNNTGWRLIIAVSGIINLTASQGSWNSYPSIYASTNTISSNEWAHIVVCRNSGVISSYINGIKDPTTVNYSASLNQTGGSSLSSYSLIGAYIADGGTFNALTGYLSDFHFKLGSAKYTTTFSPPSERLTVESGTDVLLFNKPFLKDESTNAYTTTISGNPKISPFSPYDYNEYSVTDHGGSVYFDGTGDKLIIGGSANDFNFGTNSFTIECWVYHQAAAVGPLFNTHRAGEASGYYIALLSNGGVNWGNYVDGTGDISTSANVITQNTWNHVSVNRDSSSSNSFKIYVNGILRYSGTSATDYNTFNYGPFIGGYDAGGNQFNLTGHVSDLVVVNGSVLRTGGSSVGDVAFTPPTEPIATPSNTKLHIKGTDASIIDKSQGANLKLIGNTTGSTTQVKFAGTKSMYFDGTTDYIISQEPVLLGTQDFTAECWVYYQSGLELMGNRTTSDSGGFSVRMTATSLTVGNSSGSGFGSVFSGTTSSLTNAWHHIAVSRSSGITKIYVDGSSIASYSSTINFSLSNPFVIGYAYSNGSGSDSLQGYIQDFRITKGLARYTANFTPPTAPLEG